MDGCPTSCCLRRSQQVNSFLTAQLVPEVTRVETPEEEPLAFLWAEGGVWMTRCSALYLPIFSDPDLWYPMGGLELLGDNSAVSVASQGGPE